MQIPIIMRYSIVLRTNDLIIKNQDFITYRNHEVLDVDVVAIVEISSKRHTCVAGASWSDYRRITLLRLVHIERRSQ